MALVMQIVTIVCLFIASRQIAAKLTFIALGDWGEPILDDQKEIAKAMADWTLKNKTDFIVSTGDNFYPDGVESPTDPQFDEVWRGVYNHSSLANLTWYMSMGNHDHNWDDGREWHQVEFGKTEPRWYQPSLAYSFVKDAGNAKIHFISLDSMSIRQDKNNASAMIDMLRNELATSTAEWKIVFLHRPAFSSGNYFGSGTIREQVLSLCDEYRVDVFLTGHDHSLQHLKRLNGSEIDFIISGGGGAGIYFYSQENEQRCLEHGVKLMHFVEDNGFVGFTVDGDEMLIDLVVRNATSVYSYTRKKSALSYSPQ